MVIYRIRNKMYAQDLPSLSSEVRKRSRIKAGERNKNSMGEGKKKLISVFKALAPSGEQLKRRQEN